MRSSVRALGVRDFTALLEGLVVCIGWAMPVACTSSVNGAPEGSGGMPGIAPPGGGGSLVNPPPPTSGASGQTTIGRQMGGAAGAGRVPDAGAVRGGAAGAGTVRVPDAGPTRGPAPPGDGMKFPF